MVVNLFKIWFYYDLISYIVMILNSCVENFLLRMYIVDLFCMTYSALSYRGQLDSGKYKFLLWEEGGRRLRKGMASADFCTAPLTWHRIASTINMPANCHMKIFMVKDFEELFSSNPEEGNENYPSNSLQLIHFLLIFSIG